jgi:hypothetical protein
MGSPIFIPKNTGRGVKTGEPILVGLANALVKKKEKKCTVLLLTVPRAGYIGSAHFFCHSLC